MIYFLKKLFHIGNLPYRYDQLYEVVREKRPIHIMEVGVWTGERARKMIEAAALFRPVSDIHYYGFDLFEKMGEEKFNKEISKQPPSLEEVDEKLKKTGASIHLFKGDTTHTMLLHYANVPYVDVAFIDGGHSLETIANDWLYTRKMLISGSVVIFDDYWADRTDAGAKVCVDAIDKELYNVEIMPVVDFFGKTAFGPLKIQLAKITKR